MNDITGDVLLVLNPDTIAEPGAVKALLQCIEGTGAVAGGGSLLENDGQTGARFRVPTVANLSRACSAR